MAVDTKRSGTVTYREIGRTRTANPTATREVPPGINVSSSDNPIISKGL